ncbi:MAG: outer membrane beta-barrel protein [Bacteroidetes bacterium]|nr:outer membrane beta-barrel protein [Bacteroidota bacterium]
MLRKLMIVAVIALILPRFSNAQKLASSGREFGITLGATSFYGDLGGANKIGRPLFWDLELSMTKPVVGAMYRVNMTKYVGLRADLAWAMLSGDDKLIQPRCTYCDEWYRKYRNLHFRTSIIELSGRVEVNLMRYQIGDRFRDNFTPYLFAGVGLFWFDPKARNRTGNYWVRLRPLGTEGQGLPQYPDRKKYSPVQICLPTGVGFKFNVNSRWTIGFEYGHRFTFTDYIDDVSKTYVDPDIFRASLSPGQAATTIDFANRSDIINALDPLNDTSYITAKNQQRGDPTDFDSYAFSGVVTITYTLKTGKIICPTFSR